MWISQWSDADVKREYEKYKNSKNKPANWEDIKNEYEKRIREMNRLDGSEKKDETRRTAAELDRLKASAEELIAFHEKVIRGSVDKVQKERAEESIKRAQEALAGYEEELKTAKRMDSAKNDETIWMNVRSREMYNKLEVGKTYMFDGRKEKVLEKSEDSGQKSAAGWGSGGPMVRVEWK